MISRRLGMVITVAVLLQSAPAFAADQTLDYGFFKARVEPIFLKKRPDHVRCYVCHSESNTALKLVKLPKGATFWTEEQSHQNFEAAMKVAIPGNEASPLLRHPLAIEAGGDAYHSGGRQFANKDDPDWKILAAWVNGQKAASQ